jgi:hypothetical protein
MRHGHCRSPQVITLKQKWDIFFFIYCANFAESPPPPPSSPPWQGVGKVGGPAGPSHRGGRGEGAKVGKLTDLIIASWEPFSSHLQDSFVQLFDSCSSYWKSIFATVGKIALGWVFFILFSLMFSRITFGKVYLKKQESLFSKKKLSHLNTEILKYQPTQNIIEKSFYCTYGRIIMGKSLALSSIKWTVA